jgi:hypothetical protein
MATLSSYEALVSSQHSDKPKFIATIDAVAGPAVEVFDALQKLPTDFGLDTAVGVQLDAVGRWIGRSRQLATPLLGVYFSFDTPGLGFDEGTWIGPYDPDTQLSVLPDEAYRALLYIKAAANEWDGSNAQMYEIFSNFCATVGIGPAFYQDRQDMSLVLGVSGFVTDAVLRQLILSGYIPLKPAGVRVYYVLNTVVDMPLFGFDLDTAEVAGFDESGWGASSTATVFDPEYP